MMRIQTPAIALNAPGVEAFKFKHGSPKNQELLTAQKI
jgi:hypothetical protein